jgi:cysteine desulfurase
MMAELYFDNAATTALDPIVIDTMVELLSQTYGNPSAIHSIGRSAKAKLELARKKIASLMHCQSTEIIFTSSGTEADNMAFHAAIHDLGCKTIITSEIEHKAVLECAFYYQQKGIDLYFVALDETGEVDLNDLRRLAETYPKSFISLMHANNEIGTLLDLKSVCEIAVANNCIFHSDTVQTVGHLPINLSDLDIDFITCSAHKLHGPKGVGFLYKNKKIRLKPMIMGGGQESGQRAGTENVASIVGLSKALEIAINNMDKDMAHIWKVKKYLIQQLYRVVPEIVINGDESQAGSLATILNVSFPEGTVFETLLFLLDINGVCCSGGSACTSGANTGSHVLRALGRNYNRTSIRFSFSKYNSLEEVDTLVRQISDLVKNQMAKR